MSLASQSLDASAATENATIVGALVVGESAVAEAPPAITVRAPTPTTPLATTATNLPSATAIAPEIVPVTTTNYAPLTSTTQNSITASASLAATAARKRRRAILASQRMSVYNSVDNSPTASDTANATVFPESATATSEATTLATSATVTTALSVPPLHSTIPSVEVDDSETSTDVFVTSAIEAAAAVVAAATEAAESVEMNTSAPAAPTAYNEPKVIADTTTTETIPINPPIIEHVVADNANNCASISTLNETLLSTQATPSPVIEEEPPSQPTIGVTVDSPSIHATTTVVVPPTLPLDTAKMTPAALAAAAAARSAVAAVKTKQTQCTASNTVTTTTTTQTAPGATPVTTIRYDPVVPMKKEELAAWRREARRVRNRESAAASRQRTRSRISELESEVEDWKKKYADAAARLETIRQMQQQQQSHSTI